MDETASQERILKSMLSISNLECSTSTKVRIKINVVEMVDAVEEIRKVYGSILLRCETCGAKAHSYGVVGGDKNLCGEGRCILDEEDWFGEIFKREIIRIEERMREEMTALSNIPYQERKPKTESMIKNIMNEYMIV